MTFRVVRKLDVHINEGIFELEEGDFATVWLKDGSCMTIEIIEICEKAMVIGDAYGKEQEIYYGEIEAIEQN